MVLVGPKDDDMQNLPIITSLRTYLTGMGITIRNMVEIDEPRWDNVYASNNRIRTTTKSKRCLSRNILPFLVIVIDGEFSNLLTILTSLNVDDIGSNGYLIILLCQETLIACSSGVLSKISKANIVVVSIYLFVLTFCN
jgi:hypothetical protein